METPRIGRFIETALIAFFAGAASCVLTATLFAPDSPPAMRPIDSSVPQQRESESVVESLARIETRISNLTTGLTTQGPRREPDADSSIGETLAEILERLEATGPLGAMRTQKVTCDGWTRVIDERLARCLVEHAKTPYDEGVAPFLRQATRELGAADDNFSESRRLLKERNKQRLEAAQIANLEVWAPPKEEQQVLTDGHLARTEDALERFRTALSALDS